MGLNNTFNEYIGLGIPLCKKIAERYGGSLDFAEIKGSANARLFLPLDKESTILSLGSEFTEYVSERFKPARLFMSEVLNRFS
jgi:hypothetical protein